MISKYSISSAFIVVVYLVGMVSISLNPESSIVDLTPLNLLLSGAYIILNHKLYLPNFFVGALVVAVVGFTVEMVGVQTGFIFGSYSYGDALGVKLMDVPIIIGLNWFLLVYSALCVSEFVFLSRWLRVTFAATLMTLLDILIEPVAIQLDFWKWENDIVPFQNYFAWFVISFCMAVFYYRYFQFRRRPAGIILFGLQVLFFAVLNLML